MLDPTNIPQWLREPKPLVEDKRGWLERQLDTPAMDTLLRVFVGLLILVIVAGLWMGSRA